MNPAFQRRELALTDTRLGVTRREARSGVGADAPFAVPTRCLSPATKPSCCPRAARFSLIGDDIDKTIGAITYQRTAASTAQRSP